MKMVRLADGLHGKGEVVRRKKSLHDQGFGVLSSWMDDGSSY